MSYVQPIHSSPELKPRDLDVEENVRTLTSAGAVFRQGDNSNGDATANSLSALLRRVSGNSTREIDTLIGSLHDLREMDVRARSAKAPKGLRMPWNDRIAII